MLKPILSSLFVGFLMTISEANADTPGPESRFDPPKQYYLALGDSIAFGFRFDIFNQHYPDVPPNLFHGYVDDFTALLRDIRPQIQTVNLSCVGETTDTFIQGGCLYTTQGFQLHHEYSGSQLGATLAFLTTHPGRVGPITFNLGTNDLNALAALCGADFSCYELQAHLFLNRIAANLDAILGAVRAAAPTSEIITFTNYNVTFLLDERFLDLTKAFNAVVVSMAARHGVRVAGVFEAFNVPLATQTICSLTLFCVASDSHPSEAGHRVIAEELWQASGYDRITD